MRLPLLHLLAFSKGHRLPLGLLEASPPLAAACHSTASFAAHLLTCRNPPPPQDSESFLHRSGRTGRAGNKGATVVMHTERESAALGQLLKQVRGALGRLTCVKHSDGMLAALAAAAGA